MTTTEVKTKKPKTVKTETVKAIKVAKPKTSSAVSKGRNLKKEKYRAAGENDKVILRIRVRAYESKILDSSVKQIMDTATRYDAVIVGPVPLPT